MTDHQNMSCPLCRVPLVMSERQGVEIDYCPQCRGVWLDRGELDKVIERSLRDQGPAPQATAQAHQSQYRSQDRDHGRHHGDHPHKRRKSFLEELFD
jgi:Zn-finger nucleic acid-binding protein